MKTAACPSANQSLLKHALLAITHDHRKTKTMCTFKRRIEKEETMNSRIMSQSLFQCHTIYMVTDRFGYIFDNYSLWSIRYLDTCKNKPRVQVI